MKLKSRSLLFRQNGRIQRFSNEQTEVWLNDPGSGKHGCIDIPWHWSTRNFGVRDGLELCEGRIKWNSTIYKGDRYPARVEEYPPDFAILCDPRKRENSEMRVQTLSIRRAGPNAPLSSRCWLPCGLAVYCKLVDGFRVTTPHI